MSGNGNTNAASLVATAETIVSTAASVVMAIVPGASLAGFTVAEIAAIVRGLISGAPQVVDAWNNIQAAIHGGAAPTTDQLAALKASVDAADDQIQADVAAKPQT